jgi:hypothetical protein
MSEIVLYGLDAAGAPIFTERLAPADRERLRAIAETRLAAHQAVEVWQGPMCVVRLRRPPSGLNALPSQK